MGLFPYWRQPSPLQWVDHIQCPTGPPHHAQIAIYDSALKRASLEDIQYMLSLHPLQLDVLEFAKAHPRWERFYRSRSTRVVGLTPGSHMLEVVLRRDGRSEDERCIVFHARYL